MRNENARRWLLGGLATCMALALAACGARIDTQMIASSDGAGSRVMTLTLDESEVSSLTGGSTALHESIARHKPPEIDYPGLTATPDGGLTTTFTVTFANPQEYRDKVSNLLAAGQVVTDPSTFEVRNSRFVNGVVIEETFDSGDLLMWLFNGLVADGVYGSTSEMYELGSTSFTFDGVTSEQYGSIAYTRIDDRGFVSAQFETDLSDPSSITRRIVLAIDSDDYAADPGRYDTYIADVSPEGTPAVQSQEGPRTTWAFTVTGDAATIEAATNQVLGTDNSMFTVTKGIDDDDPATLTLAVVDYTECDVCSADAPGFTDAVALPAGFTDDVGFATEPVTVELGTDSTEQHVFSSVLPVESLAVNTDLGLLGGVTTTVTFTVANQHADLAGDGFDRMFAVPEGAGTLTVDRGEETTTYTVEITGADGQTLNTALQQWIPAAQVTVADGERAGFFTADKAVHLDYGLEDLLGNHLVSGETTYSVSLPWGHKVIDPADAPAEYGATPGVTATSGMLGLFGAGATSVQADPAQPLTLAVGGLPLTGLITVGVVLLLLLAGLVVLLVLRKRLAAAGARRRQARAARAEAVRPRVQVAAPSAVPPDAAPQPDARNAVAPAPPIHAPVPPPDADNEADYL